MNQQEINLPSNRKFGLTFTVIFIILAIYFYFYQNNVLASIILTIGILFFPLTFLNESSLLPLNKLWMKFGFLLGKIMSPIIIALIFFGLFTPISILMFIFGRVELKLKNKKTKTNWILREDVIDKNIFFKQQF